MRVRIAQATLHRRFRAAAGRSDVVQALTFQSAKHPRRTHERRQPFELAVEPSYFRARLRRRVVCLLSRLVSELVETEPRAQFPSPEPPDGSPYTNASQPTFDRTRVADA